MAIVTANAKFVTPEERNQAARGMQSVVDVKVLPSMEIYRFARSSDQRSWFAASWWIGKSVHEALLQYSKTMGTGLSRAARACLAVPPEWSTMDVLISARVVRPLSAWSGTPSTVRVKAQSPPTQPVVRPDGSVLLPGSGHAMGGRYGPRWEPDRAMTQLYIPGLKPNPAGQGCVPWQEVLFAGVPFFLPE